MKIVVLFFMWIATTSNADVDSIVIQESARCKSIDPAAELTVWPSVMRRYKFEWKGLESRSVYAGYDLICAVVRKQVVRNQQGG